MSYKVEKDFIHNGYRCVVIMTDMGHRCGYVGVDNTHQFFGKDYSDTTTKEMIDKIKDSPTGKRGIIDLLCYDPEAPRIGILFDVHGGITYSGGKKDYPVESDLWWFGYDCAHADDGKDLSVVSDVVREIELKFPTEGIVRSLDYCINECKSLAEQLEEFKEVGDEDTNKEIPKQ